MVTLTDRGKLTKPNNLELGSRSVSQIDVCLVQMPFADIVRPSLALSLLKAALDAGGIRSVVEYGNIAFADMLGATLPDLPYLRQFLGEWVFASAAFPDQPLSPPDTLLERSSQVAWMPTAAFRSTRMREILLELQALTPHFVEQLACKVVARRPRIVGCSSMFEQHCASLALLRAVKRLDPSILTMMGGANCEAEMGWSTICSFDWIDYVVSGEADELFLPLCRDLLAVGPHLSPEQLPAGVFNRAQVDAGHVPGSNGEVPRASVWQMDNSPVPNFDDYFETLENSSFNGRIGAGLPVETSRGCWWGAKSHCTFCGLNGGGMAYRSKSPARVISEFEQLSDRYGIQRFMVADNILDMSYLKSVMPIWEERQAPYQIFYETKANLKRDQVRQLAKAGVVWFQPGIEGLHDDLLKLMEKGNSAMINLQLLKYAREFGIYTTWLMLTGFPDEKEDWHQEVADWLPMVFHLQPPSCMEPVLYERFSVFHTKPEAFGLTLRPDPFYQQIFPVPAETIEQLVFFFINPDRPGKEAISPQRLALARQVGQWSALHKRSLRPLLCMETDEAGQIEIFDTRPCATARRHRLTGLEAKIYGVCDPATTRPALVKRFAESDPAEAVETAIENLKADNLLLDFAGKLLALAVPGDCPPYCDVKAYPGGNGRRPPPFEMALLDEFHERVGRLRRELAKDAEPTPPIIAS